LVDEILAISDDTSQDTILNENGTALCNYEHINRSRLRIDTRKWLAAKLCPRFYGEKKDEHISLTFPDDLARGSSLLPMSAEIFRALNSQEITPAQAKTLLSSLKDHGANLITGDLERRLTELEATEDKTK
jgi:hypothetical protein